MATINFDPAMILAMVNLEMEKVHKIELELARLQSIGYLNSQTGLDIWNNSKWRNALWKNGAYFVRKEK